MFSRILNSARNIITFNKPDQIDESEKNSPGKRSPGKRAPARETVVTKSTMVTTRRQSGALQSSKTNSAVTEDIEVPNEVLSASARKRRHAQLSEKAKSEEDVSTPTTKRRKLPVRTKREDSPQIVHSHIAVEIPAREFPLEASKPSPKPAPKKTAKQTPKKKSPASVVKLIDEEVAAEDEPTPKESEEVAEEDAIAVEAPPKAKRGRRGKTDPTSTSPKEAEVKAPVTKPKHKKFGDDDIIEAPAPVQLEEEEAGQDDDEDESSDDDAPEEVGAQAAQDKVKDAAREAAKAAEKKEATERQKRKERDAQLKSQAKAAKKRKHIEEEVDESVTVDDSSAAVEQLGRIPSKAKFDRSNLPDLLPEDFLLDTVMEEAEVESEEEAPRKSKKIKFVYPEEKKPKDKKLGSTTYRVAQTNKEGLAPKASHNAQATKSALLGGRKGQLRKAVSTGFLSSKKARK